MKGKKNGLIGGKSAFYGGQFIEILSFQNRRTNFDRGNIW